MKSKILILIVIVLLTGCRSAGSWYKRTPAAVTQLQIEDINNNPYSAARISYNNMIYDLIIINPLNVQLEIAVNESEGLLNPEKKEKPFFAVNGGIFQKNREALGFLSYKGIKLHNLNRADGWGNFYLKPNGVFFINDNNIPGILETEEFALLLKEGLEIPLLATQSGPLLLHNGQINKEFNEGSSNKFVRNGVGIIKSDKSELIVFVISNRPVNFLDFASFFKDFLKCSDALYLDGHISKMYLPALERYQNKGFFGPVISGYIPQ